MKLTKISVVLSFLFLISSSNLLAIEMNNSNYSLNFIASGIFGANYFVSDTRNAGYSSSGWGTDYGLDAELRFIFIQKNLGISISYGNIFTTIIEKEQLENPWVVTRKVTRQPLILKVLLCPKGRFNPWIGFGKEYFTITDSELNTGNFIFKQSEFNVTEEMQVIVLGMDLGLSQLIILSPEIRYGTNTTNIKIDKNTSWQSWQFLIKGGVKFK